MKMYFKTLLFVLAAVGGVAHAETVGRTQFDLPSGQWSVLVEYQQHLTFKKLNQTTPLHTRVFRRTDGSGATVALLTVTSSEAGYGGKITWHNASCPEPHALYFTDDFGSNKQPDTRDCLVVSAAFAPYKFYKEDSEVFKALEAQNVQLFKAGYSARALYASNNATYLNVLLVANRSWQGLKNGIAQSPQHYDVPDPLLSWGEQLHRAVKDSVQSMSGRLELPPIEF